MNVKKFSIFASIIVSVMIVICVVCCFIVIPTPFSFNSEPSSITVYNYSESSTGVTATKTNNHNSDFEKLFAEFQKTTTLTVFERVYSGANIYKKASQDVDQQKPTWAKAKGNAVTIELSFNEKESMIVYINGYSKKIDFYALAMVVDNTKAVHEVSLYFKSTLGGSYTSAPILLQMKTNKLYNQIMTIDF